MSSQTQLLGPSSYSLSKSIIVTVTYLECSSPTVWGLVASLVEQEQSTRALYRETTCSRIHLWSQLAQQSENDKDNMARLSTKFNCGLHSSTQKVLTRQKCDDMLMVRKREILLKHDRHNTLPAMSSHSCVEALCNISALKEQHVIVCNYKIMSLSVC